MPSKFQYKIGNNLREQPLKPKLFKEQIQELVVKTNNTTDPEQKATQLSKLGSYYRIIGELNKSENVLAKAAKIISTNNFNQLEVTNLIRIATTLQFKGEHQKADQLYDHIEHLITTSKKDDNLLDFVHQHRAKNLFEQGNHEQALLFFEQALNLRVTKGDQALIKSTELAIKVVRKQLKV